VKQKEAPLVTGQRAVEGRRPEKTGSTPEENPNKKSLKGGVATREIEDFETCAHIVTLEGGGKGQ